MSMNNRKIAGFMTAEGIYSLAFYIIMVAAIAGIGAGVMVKKDSAKAAAAISLIRANFVADTATLGAPTGVMTSAYVAKMSGNLLEAGATAGTGVLPGGGTVSIVARTFAGGPSYSINILDIKSAEICNAVGGVGWGTWNGFHATATSTAPVASTAAIPSTIATKAGARAICDGIPTAKASMMFGFNI